MLRKVPVVPEEELWQAHLAAKALLDIIATRTGRRFKPGVLTIGRLGEDVPTVYLPRYDLELAKALVAGVDVWLNTPLRPLEASGISGMKAAHNGVPSALAPAGIASERMAPAIATSRRDGGSRALNPRLIIEAMRATPAARPARTTRSVALFRFALSR
jgi:hypothetical protein